MSISTAQATQQSNRTSDGKYTFGTHAEPRGLALATPGMRPLEDGERIDFGGDENAGISSYSLKRFGEIYVGQAEAKPLNLHHAVAPGWVKPQRIEEVMTDSRRQCVAQFVRREYGIVLSADGSNSAKVSVRAQVPFDEQPGEQELMRELWSQIELFEFAAGPGAIGEQRLDQQFNDHMDQHCFADLRPQADMALGLVQPRKWLDQISELSLEGDLLLDEQSAIDIAAATPMEKRGPAITQLVENGYVERQSLADEANLIGGMRHLALAQWAQGQPRTSDLMRQGLNPVFGADRPMAAQQAVSDLNNAQQNLEDSWPGTPGYESLLAIYRAAEQTRNQYWGYS